MQGPDGDESVSHPRGPQVRIRARGAKGTAAGTSGHIDPDGIEPTKMLRARSRVG
jgi:hypothetical protein